MSIFSRFFGQHGEEGGGTQLIANPQIETPLSLQLLFDRRLRLQSSDVTASLQGFHGSMANARCEIDPTLGEEGKIFGIAGWANHVVKLVGFDLPMPAEAVESCVAPSHYPQELKDRARSHSGHLLLFYAGYESSPHEQYVALASAAGALSQFGAIVILNEAARTSLPAAALLGSNVDGDIIELLRTLPLAIFYCGFVKCEVDGTPGVWMRTPRILVVSRRPLLEWNFFLTAIKSSKRCFCESLPPITLLHLTSQTLMLRFGNQLTKQGVLPLREA